MPILVKSALVLLLQLTQKCCFFRSAVQRVLIHDEMAVHKMFEANRFKNLRPLKADLRPADAHHVAPAATLGHCGLGSAQDPDVDGVVQRLQAILSMGQHSCIPLEGQATDILNDHHPGKLVHNILQTVKQESTLGS